MPNQRGEDQSVITLQIGPELRAALREAIAATGKTQSQIIRDAITSDLHQRGYALRETAAHPPPRIGGAKPFKYPPIKRKKKGEP
jgi:hypothetical protein